MSLEIDILFIRGKMRHKNNLQVVKSSVNRISSRIDRIIRSRKTIAIGFAASLMLSQLCLSCKDTSKSDYIIKTIVTTQAGE
jgi:hypothetical protein